MPRRLSAAAQHCNLLRRRRIRDIVTGRFRPVRPQRIAVMTAPRNLHRYRILSLCLLMASAGAFAEARDVHMQGPNSGGGECVQADPALDADDVPGVDAAATATQATKPTGSTRIKPVIGVRGGGDAGGG